MVRDKSIRLSRTDNIVIMLGIQPLKAHDVLKMALMRVIDSKHAACKQH
jgi:hypothetical protein